MLVTEKIKNLYSFLKETKENEIVIMTTKVPGCWDDVQSSAFSAGFDVSKFINPYYEKQHKFSWCYLFKRRA